jgi:hypothetical protein
MSAARPEAGQGAVHTRAATHGEVVATELASGRRLAEPLTVTLLFDSPDAVERALDALYTAGTPRDLIEVVVSREAAERYYAAQGGRVQRRGREIFRYAGAGALLGFVGGVLISLVMVAWPGIEAPGGLALVQLAGPNFGTVAGAALGAIIGAFRRQRPRASYARAAEAANAILFAVVARTDEEAAVIARLLAGQGGRDVHVDSSTG